MQAVANQHVVAPATAPSRAHCDPPFTPLDRETRETVETAAAAYHLNRQPQTLRGWACLENGPIRPLRINGRLAWRVADLRRLLSGGAE
jgi:hypothetical protein